MTEKEIEHYKFQIQELKEELRELEERKKILVARLE